jgi:FtsZ-binding cell division protein ZapB
MSNQEESNPMNVDANVLLDDYKKQVGDLDLSIKVKDTQIKNFQRENQRLRERVKSLQEQINTLSGKDEKSSKDKK